MLYGLMRDIVVIIDFRASGASVRSRIVQAAPLWLPRAAEILAHDHRALDLLDAGQACHAVRYLVSVWAVKYNPLDHRTASSPRVHRGLIHQA